ncbi:acyltransferase [Enterobacterales bacterium CwR94]|nr:acyltransferase [Enterobacterales bacterium CwR94]
MPVAFSPCVVIPCYNHGAMMASVLARLAPCGLPIVIVDDGSDSATQQQLTALAASSPHVRLIRQPTNGGKGEAVLQGLRAAAEAGYSHGVQVDADGQHAIEDIPALLALAAQQPEALISGQPLYDDSIPRSRLYGRWVTHVWVWIETLSLSIKDSMCGFRVYPIAPTLALAERVALGKRMDFDTEVMVRLYWQGHPSVFLPTRVTYPADGLSHFDALKDNLRISWMHTRLFFGMLPRAPRLLFRSPQRHWARTQEARGLTGMRIMLRVWKTLGRSAFELLLRPVIGVYWLSGHRARQASQQWLHQVTTTLQQQQKPLPPGLNSYQHFLSFGRAMLDKIASWQGELQLGQQLVMAPGAEDTLRSSPTRGKLILASHLGNIEVCRALAAREGHRTINALVFHDNAQRFQQIMAEMAPQAGVNLIPVTQMGPETAMLLQEKLDRGEWVAIVGDRVAVNRQRGGDYRVVWSAFLGRPAPFPQGPFILAAALRCPVVLLFALREANNIVIHCEPFADPLTLPRATRQQALQDAVDRYASRLSHYALQAPLDWFNFFDFWQLPEPTSAEKDKE